MSTPRIITPIAPVAYSLIGAAAALGVSVGYIERLLRDDRLPSRYLGGKRLIRATDLIELVDALPFSRP